MPDPAQDDDDYCYYDYYTPPTMSSQAKVEIRVGLVMPPLPYVIGRMLSPSGGVFVPGSTRLPGLFMGVGEATEAWLFEADLAGGSRLLISVKGMSTIANSSIVAHRSIICEKFLDMYTPCLLFRTIFTTLLI